MRLNSRTNSLLSFIFLLLFAASAGAQGLPGDVDGNGAVDADDARMIARFLVKQVPTLTKPENADANEDGDIDMEDAFIIAKKATGQTRIIVVAPVNASTQLLPAGSTVRIEVFERFFPFNIRGGTVRIRSTNAAYDSGDQSLTFERDGRSLYYHWNTAGLPPAADYTVSVILTDAAGNQVSAAKSSAKAESMGSAYAEAAVSSAQVTLSSQVYSDLANLAEAVDAYCPAPGLALEFRRRNPNNAPAFPYLGPLGRGWIHSYDLKLEEQTDGRITLFSRAFSSKGSGRYESSPGDHGVLVRDSDGSFKLTEKDGLFHRFRPDLMWDYTQDLNENRVSAIYDSAHRLVEIRHSSGKSFFLEYDETGKIARLIDHAGRVTSYHYAASQLVRVADPTGAVTAYSYTSPPLRYYVNHLLMCDLNGASTLCPADLSVLDDRLQSVAYPDGTHIHYEFDANAHLVKRTGTWGANPIMYSYDADGTTRLTDALGAGTVVKANESGNPTAVVTADEAQTSYEYDSSHNVIKMADPLSHTTRYSYDGAGNLTKVVDPLGNAVQMEYDPRFNKASSIISPLGKATKLSYDEKGNLSSIVYPNATHEGFEYDANGNLISARDSAGKMTKYGYNAQGNVTSVENALGNSTQFSYDEASDLAVVTDARGNATTHTRDQLGRLTRRTYPDGSHEDYEYDPAGKVTAFTNRRGEKLSYSYNGSGQLERKMYPSGKQYQLFYDAAGYLVRVDRIENGTNLDVAYERDALHRVTKVRVPGRTASETYDVSYTYDLAGNRSSMTYPDGYKINYSYDANNRLIQIVEDGKGLIVKYEYDAAGRRTKRTLGNGTYTTYAYDSLDRLTDLFNFAPDGAVQSKFIYTYNAAGMRTSMKTLEGTHLYTYDDTYQLTQVQYPDGQKVEYEFDSVGNRTKVESGVPATEYDTNQRNQYVRVDTETRLYDENGNLTDGFIDGAATKYMWDEDDRLIGIQRKGLAIDYSYYEGYRLASKMIRGQRIRYVWDGDSLVCEGDSTGHIARRYVYGALIDEIIVTSSDGANHWAQQDGLGSVIGGTDDIGNRIVQRTYDVYGDMRNGESGPMPHQMSGMWWDSDAKLYYVRARWYSPGEGRFISEDPLKSLSGENAYTYVKNDPASFVDPLGLWYANATISIGYWSPSVSVGPNGVSWCILCAGIGFGGGVFFHSGNPAPGWGGYAFKTFGGYGISYSSTDGIGVGFGVGWGQSFGYSGGGGHAQHLSKDPRNPPTKLDRILKPKASSVPKLAFQQLGS